MRAWPPRCAGLTADDVRWAYRALLGREAADAEVAQQVAAAPDLRTLVAAIFTSAELRARLVPDDVATPKPPLHVNTWHPDFAAHTHPAGTWSEDGVAVVGHDGSLFLAGGTNAVLEQHRGQFAVPEDWHESWARAIAVRREGAAALGAAYVGVMVPDKLSVIPEHFPEDLPTGVRPPAAMLAGDEALDVHYPLDEMRAVRSGAFYRVDTHLSYAGNVAVAAVVLGALGVEADLPAAPPGAVQSVICGDLGHRFVPPIVEVVTVGTTFGAATVVEDNRDELLAIDAHVGSRRVLRNETAPDPRTVVIFGDSYAFPNPNYQCFSWFLAQSFREVHVLWMPFGWDSGYVEEVGPEVIVCQAAERFAVRPPDLDVDIRRLAAETLARSRADGARRPADAGERARLEA